MEWDWDFAWSILPQLLAGVRVTLIATALGAVVAAVLGLPVVAEVPVAARVARSVDAGLLLHRGDAASVRALAGAT